MQNEPPEKRFRTNMETVCNKIKKYVASANSASGQQVMPEYLIEGVMTYVLSQKPSELIERFIVYSYGYWNEIANKDENFFRKNAIKIFLQDQNHDLGKEMIVKFEMVLDTKVNGKPIVDDKERESLWRIFLGFIRISIRYVEQNNLSKGGKFTANKITIPFEIENLKKIYCR